jgi:hypothetical protein
MLKMKLFSVAPGFMSAMLSVAACYSQPMTTIEKDCDIQRSEREGYQMRLFIDSDNNNGTELPDFSEWEETVRTHEFSIGKVISVGEKNCVPLVIRLVKDKVQAKNTGEDLLEQGFIVFHYFGPVGKIAIWKSDTKGKPQDGKLLSEQLDLGLPYKLSDLNYDPKLEQVIVWIEAVESVPHLVTKDDIDRRGRPDLYLRVEYGSRNLANDGRSETVRSNVKILPVEPNSFFTNYVLPKNRHVRDAIAAGLVNGRQWYDGNIRPVLPQESRSYGLQLVTRDELAAILETSDALMSFYSGILYWDNSTGRGPIDSSMLAATGQRVGLYRNWCTGEFTIAIQDFRIRPAVQKLFLRKGQTLDGLRQSFTPTGKIVQIGGFCLSMEEEISQRGAQIKNLRVTGHGAGGQLAVFGSIVSGLEATVFNTEPFPRFYAEFGLTHEKTPGSKQFIEIFPDSLKRIDDVNTLIQAYSLTEHPFVTNRIDFNLK